MGDQYDKWFERSQRLGHESQNLEEYIEKRITESYVREERLRKLDLGRKKEVSERQESERKAESERRERDFANEAEKRRAEAEEHEREAALRKSKYRRQVKLLRMRHETGLNPDATPTQKHRGQSYPVLTNSATTSTLERFAKSQNWAL